MTSPLHAVTWMVWAVAVTVSLQLARNPLLVAVVLAAVWVVVETHRRPGALARAFPVLLAVATAFGLLRVVLIGLTTPAAEGASGVLVTLPQATLPRLLGGISVGGAVSQSVVLTTAIDSLVLIGIMAAFGAFNSVASHHELLAAAPRAFHEPGLVLTVGLAFVPATLDAATAAREADRARTGGVRVRRGRALRQALPVLETGLERAVRLAESMDARGYGRSRARTGDRVAAVLGTGALLALAGAVVALVGEAGGVAAALAAVGVVTLVGAVVVSGRSAPSRYRRRRLTRRDAAVMAGVLAVPAALGLCVGLGVDGLVWDPAVLPFRPPPLPVVPAVLLVGLALPAVVRPVRGVLPTPAPAAAA
ncbi:CbiQ family ECF transporter T component [Iamia majanohamensis]|uniref:CbiQ family ECF transporter T component n=1 Tax=Iamia majanohamensis TaxID=467976 RepID=A0AAE9Y3M9_9ACTN|nr:CbiQ family ECF transporter T component [Iamia majanohamensis]WCO65235.1 CbiQ family ECF transporter T component [Iamia majanohamensis]